MKHLNKDGSLDRRFKENQTLEVREWLFWQKYGNLVVAGLLGLIAGTVLTVSLWRGRNASLTPPAPPSDNLDVGTVKGVGKSLVDVVEASEPSQTPREWRGIASYYSRSGCIGCSPTLTMANGQPLDDDALTVAFNRLPLGSKVRITNAKSKMTVVATVTDTGGFERLGRIIDVTPRVRDSLNCTDLCDVIVEEVI